MVERFVAFAGTISVANGASTVVGTGTAFAGRDREGAQVWVQPAGAAPYRVGTVAAVDPRGIYENLSLPLLHAWNGDAIVDQPYELVDGPAIANGASQAAIYARFAAFLEQNMGLVGNPIRISGRSVNRPVAIPAASGFVPGDGAQQSVRNRWQAGRSDGWPEARQRSELRDQIAKPGPARRRKGSDAAPAAAAQQGDLARLGAIAPDARFETG